MHANEAQVTPAAVPPEADIAREARALYAASQQGVLSTLSVDLAGYPFGSVATFAPDRGGQPVIFISEIAQHTKNIRRDARVSLTLLAGGDDIQAGGRLTLIGDVAQLAGDDEADAAARYFRRFPQAAHYREAHAFHFYRIQLIRVRYIGGFGRIHWLAPDDLRRINPFGGDAERRMIDHMNADHIDALRGYCRLSGIDAGAGTPRLTAIDADGFDVMLDRRLVRFSFDAPANCAEDVRAQMVALARRAREPVRAGA